MKKIGCSTAKNVLATSRERLIREADLEESTVDEILSILRFEFEEEEENNIAEQEYTASQNNHVEQEETEEEEERP